MKMDNLRRYPDVSEMEGYRNLNARMAEMLNKGIMRDVTFVIQGIKIQAHRSIVGSYGGPLRDLLESMEELIEITDIAPETFMLILEYIYTDNCTVDASNVFVILHAAIKFHLKNLELRCTNIIVRKIRPTNVGAYTAEALNFDAKELLQVCQEYFSSNTLDVILTDEFLKITFEVLATFCSSESITCPEGLLFLICVEWAKNKCDQLSLSITPANLRDVLGEVFYKIRFPCITQTDFQEYIIPLNLLSFEEVGEIIVGWRTRNMKSRYSHLDRSGNVKVIIVSCYSVEEYYPLYFLTATRLRKSQMNESVLHVQKSTTIRQLKRMKIFNGGTKQYRPHEFSLKHKGKWMDPDVTLGSICTPGEYLILEVE